MAELSPELEHRIYRKCGEAFTPTHHTQRYHPECSPYTLRGSSRFTEAQLEWLKHRSFENMVTFYSKELRRINRHGRAPRSLSGTERRALIKRGLLIRANPQREKLLVAPAALVILQSLGEEG